MFDMNELNRLTEKLENMQDQQLAIKYLSSFSQTKSSFDQLVANRDTDLSHDEWKKQCDKLQRQLNLLVEQILAAD